MEAYLVSKEIAMVLTAAGDPESNGRIERANRTVIEPARAMMLQEAVPVYLWGAAVQHTVWLLNRLPTRAAPGGLKTPHELLYTVVPDISRLRTFGCDAYYYVPEQERGTLDSKARKALFVGLDSYGFKLFDVTRQRFLVSRHVVFNETVRATVRSQETGRQSCIQPPANSAVDALTFFDDWEASRIPPQVGVSVPSSELPLSSTVPTIPPMVQSSDKAVLEEAWSILQDPAAVLPSTTVTHDNVATCAHADPHTLAHLGGDARVDTLTSTLAQSRVASGGVDSWEAVAGYLDTSTLPSEPSNLTLQQEFAAITAQARAEALVPPGQEAGVRRSARLAARVASVSTLETLVVQAEGSDPLQQPPYLLCAISARGMTAPHSYRQAMASADAAAWTEAMAVEIRGFGKHEVYCVMERSAVPIGAEILNFMWIYTIKVNDRGELMKHKARAVILGNLQTGVSDAKTYSAVVKLDALRLILSLAASENLTIYQLDIDQAFLLGALDEVVYAYPPAGCEDQGKIWMLKRAVYGLRQAPKIFNDFLNAVLLELGYQRMLSDECVYKLQKDGCIALVGLHVDDLAIAVSHHHLYDELKAGLRRVMDIKDLGRIQICLGLHIQQDDTTGCVTVTQEQFIDEILVAANLTDSRPVSTPFVHTVVFEPADCSTTEAQKQAMTEAPFNLYRQLVGQLQYLVSGCRPDIALAVNYLSRYVSNYGPKHFTALKHLLRYLKGTRRNGLVYCGYKLQPTFLPLARTGALSSLGNVLVGFSDSDWARDLNNRRSTSGYCFFLNGALVSWRVRVQRSVALSTAEAELMALCEAAKQGVWLRRLLKEMGHSQSPTVIYEDNQGAIAMTQHNAFHDRSKHVDLRYHYIREQLAAGEVEVSYCPTADMLADLFTKPLGPEKLPALVSKILGQY
jgi:hypothetical protein